VVAEQACSGLDRSPQCGRIRLGAATCRIEEHSRGETEDGSLCGFREAKSGVEGERQMLSRTTCAQSSGGPFDGGSKLNRAVGEG